MNRPRPQTVDNRLQEEARLLRARTEFSPLLHQRILASLHQAGLTVETPAPHRRMPLFWRVAIPAGIAAIIAAGTWIALRPPAETPPKEIVQTHPTLPTVEVPKLPPNSTDIATNALERGKYAYLDRDANRLMTFVADQIPSFPQPK